jgi:hypothetical protein
MSLAVDYLNKYLELWVPASFSLYTRYCHLCFSC